MTLVGVLVLAHPPSSRYAVHSANSVAKHAPPARAFLVMGGYVVIVGLGAFLEKPALRGLDAVQLNGLIALPKSGSDGRGSDGGGGVGSLTSWVCAACLSP